MSSDVKWPRRAKNKSSGVTWEQLEQGDDWVAVNPSPYTEIGDRRTGEFALQMLEEGHWTLVDHHSQQPAPVETFVPTWGPEWEYLAHHGTVFTFLLDDKSDVAPIKLACEFGDVWFSRDGAAAFGASWAIVSQRPRTPAPVETKSSPKDRSPCCGASVSHVLMCDHCASEFLPEPPAPSQPADVEEVDVAELRERLAAAEEERDEPKASFDLEDDGTPEYGTPAYELFDKAITWTVHQLKNVLGVKEWSTSGGGTETLDGDLRMELNDLLKAAGRDDDSMETLRADLARTKEALQRVVTEAEPLAKDCQPAPHACHACEILFVAKEALAQHEEGGE